MSFRQKLAFGQKYQELAKRYIPEDEKILEDAQGNQKEYDFKTDKYSYEVKSDRMGYAYGCQTMFIEYECNGKPSGISSTTSDYYFYFFHKPDGYVAYEIPIENLKKACVGCREILKAGDGGRVKAYVVPVLPEFKL
jgi:hypothetical protein